jgi:palmitoyl transferase
MKTISSSNLTIPSKSAQNALNTKFFQRFGTHFFVFFCVISISALNTEAFASSADEATSSEISSIQVASSQASDRQSTDRQAQSNPLTSSVAISGDGQVTINNSLNLGTVGGSTTTVGESTASASDVSPPSASTSPSTSAKLKTAYNTAVEHVKDTWTEGKVEIYVPFLAYHMPFAYTAEQRSDQNQYPAGGGIGLGRYNASGNYEGTYAMAFLDSHSDMSYVVGYSWVPTWNVGKSDVKVGAGLTGFLMSRQDYFGGVPFPGILPMASISYKQLSLQATYVPGGQGNGNVLFAWGKWTFD